MARTHLKRPASANSTSKATNGSLPDVPRIVKEVIDSIRREGDVAVQRHSEQFDNWSPSNFKLCKEDIDKVMAQVPEQVINDIKAVQSNVRKFAEAQLNSIQEFELEMARGVFLGQKNNPIDSVGAYVPGGRYPLLASAHMTILTAKVAGVRNVVACTPPAAGEIPLATVAAMHLAGADEIFILGGIQAIAAMAIGTETVPKVDFIAGPGNAFVAEAKRQLFGQIGIDLFAGPTEVLIVADETADPYMIATDLLSQAEHGPDTPAVLICTSAEVAKRAIEYCDEQLETLKTAAVASVSWRDYGRSFLLIRLMRPTRLPTSFASEHVQILTANHRDALTKMQHYGALFLGPMTCVSFGDKCIGTNHVLPTKHASRYTGGLWVGKFLRTVTYQEVKSAQASGELAKMENKTPTDNARKDLRTIKRFDAPFQTLPDNVDFALCYATDQFPVNLNDEADINTYRHYTENLPGITLPTGTVLRVVDIPPGAISPMHRTISLDYGVVLEGEIDLILDSGEKRPATCLRVAGEELHDNSMHTIPGYEEEVGAKN
ncbi:histidinol dehydrogenase [Fusarium oxysporum]|nr:histidinol dehydrogenase [Fusarium oxysporum]